MGKNNCYYIVQAFVLNTIIYLLQHALWRVVLAKINLVLLPLLSNIHGLIIFFCWWFRGACRFAVFLHTLFNTRPLRAKPSFVNFTLYCLSRFALLCVLFTGQLPFCYITIAVFFRCSIKKNY